MAKAKKALDKAFHQAAINAIGRRSAYEIEKEHGLPQQSIARVLDGTNPELSRAIEIAHALGFELRYEWRDAAVSRNARDSATDLAVEMTKRARPEHRELTDHPDISGFARDLIAAYENYARELGPDRASDVDGATLQQYRVLNHIFPKGDD